MNARMWMRSLVAATALATVAASAVAWADVPDILGTVESGGGAL